MLSLRSQVAGQSLWRGGRTEWSSGLADLPRGGCRHRHPHAGRCHPVGNPRRRRTARPATLTSPDRDGVLLVPRGAATGVYAHPSLWAAVGLASLAAAITSLVVAEAQAPRS